MAKPTKRSRRAELRLAPIQEEDHLGDSIDSIPDVLMGWGLHQEPQKCVWVVAYDAEMTVRTVVEIARGTYRGAELHIPTLLAAVLTSGSERFVMAHNHLDGKLTPSENDLAMTDMVMDAAKACWLFFEDHYILTPSGSWYSFAKNDQLVPADYATHKWAEDQ